MVRQPRIFSGYRYLSPVTFSQPEYKFAMDPRVNAYDRNRYEGILYAAPVDSTLLEPGDEVLILTESPQMPTGTPADNAMQAYMADDFPIYQAPSAVPQWLEVGMTSDRILQDIIYRTMTSDPSTIQTAYWDLPVPPRLPEEDKSFAGYLRRLEVAQIVPDAAIIPEENLTRLNWIHTVNGGLQLSQAYISSNWYQGGNNYLAILFNFNWNVALNTVYHPNLLFVSDLSYKLAVNSNPKGSLHRYSISQDQFQYTLKTGVKAMKKWFYSLNLLFKTQFFTAFAENSDVMNAKFLSPMEFNLGLGMTYSTKALKDRLDFNVSISPFSYNLKACPSMKIDHLQFNIRPDRKSVSQFGSSAEATLTWNITDNISWKSRLFLFSNYKYFQADWENTFNFAINRFLSTQLYIYPRFDSSTGNPATKWHYWQLKEILSFGLSYTFSTKP